MKYGFAGNKKIAVEILLFLIEEGFKPSFLLINDQLNGTTYQEELIELSGLSFNHIYDLDDVNNIKENSPLKKYDVDYIFGIHFPFIIKPPVLELPKIGFLNLHPAYLPYNKGWHTPSWAIIDNSPYGATLHFMTEELDGGDIVAQKELEVKPNFTANELYKSVLEVEKQLFKDTLPNLLSLDPSKIKQVSKGTSYSKKDLAKVQKIDLNNKVSPIDLINKLRALTTNNIDEAAYFIINEKKYKVQVSIISD